MIEQGGGGRLALAGGQRFVAKRKAISLAQIEDGIAAEIEVSVGALLPS